MRAKLRSVLVTIAIILNSACLMAQSVALNDWQAFRKVHPYHIQTVALSDVYPDHHRGLIISEPPPHVTLAKLASIDGVMRNAVVKKQGIGYDGFVKDVLVDLPPMTDAKLAELLDAIHRELFGTSYKAYAIPIRGTDFHDRPADFDLHVTSGELRSWLLSVPKGRTASWTSLRIILFGLLLVVYLRLLQVSVDRKSVV